MDYFFGSKRKVIIAATEMQPVDRAMHLTFALKECNMDNGVISIKVILEIDIELTHGPLYA